MLNFTPVWERNYFEWEENFPKCEKCNKEIDEIDYERYGGMCEECYLKSKLFEDSLTLENALNDGNQKIEIPQFLAYVFDEEQIKEILTAKFKELFPEQKKKLIKDYVMDDVPAWAERLSE